MTTRVATFSLRLPVSLKAALEKIAERDGTSMSQFLVIAAAEKISAMETESFFAERRVRADDEAFLRILNRRGPRTPSTEARDWRKAHCVALNTEGETHARFHHSDGQQCRTFSGVL